MLFPGMPTDAMRNLARHQIETLERWLRRLIDEALRAHYGGALSALPIKQDIKDKAAGRRADDPGRYPREVDALLFNDLITIICHQQLYPHFRDALQDAFPDGVAEARTFLNRIVDPRNPLSHTNDITSHQALRVACYSADVIESLKAYYARNNLAQTYNAPSFIRVWDDQGNNAQIEKTDACFFDFTGTQLRPGDILQLEVQPDESFPEGAYRIEWQVCNVPQGESGSGRSFSLTIANRHVTQSGLPIQVKIISDRDWHRHGTFDAMFVATYSVLPPV